MSIGNLKDSGNQGNNFPYQKSVLKGLALSQLKNLTQTSATAATAANLDTAVNAVLAANPNKYLVSQSVVWNGTTFYAFLTLANIK